jgi:hypothetical protein
MNIQQLIDDIVAMLTALDTELGVERMKVRAAITSLTGQVFEGDDAALSAAVQSAIGRLGKVADDSEATAR